MHRTTWTRLFFAAAAAFALGCSQQASQSGKDADDELAALVERADRLRERLAAGSVSNRELRPDFDELLADVRAWQAQTGRTDIRTGTDSTRAPGTGTAARDNDGGDDTCASCPGYRLHGDHICFLVKEEPCPDADDEVLAGRACVYECIWIGSGTEPATGGEAKR